VTDAEFVVGMGRSMGRRHVLLNDLVLGILSKKEEDDEDGKKKIEGKSD